MTDLFNQETVDIAFVQAPAGVNLAQDEALFGLRLRCRAGNTSELQKLLREEPQKPTVFVVGEDQLEFFAELKKRNNIDEIKNNNWIILLLTHQPVAEGAEARVLTNEPGIKSLVFRSVYKEVERSQFMTELAFTSQHLLYKIGRRVVENLSNQRNMAGEAMNAVGVAMAGQYSIDEFMKVILEKSVEVSNADAGFLLLREHLFDEHGTIDSNNVRKLRHTGTKFTQKARQVKSQNLRLAPEMLDPSRSELMSIVVNRVCGVSWVDGGKVELWHNDWLKVDATHGVPQIKFDNELVNYNVRSYCAFPLRTPNEEVVGILLLVNRKVDGESTLHSLEDIHRSVVSFNSFDLSMIEAFTAQAGVFTDHTLLYRELTTVFESFVGASVMAIESRDPSTRGHSERVAALTVAFAEAVNRVHSGSYANIYFTQSQLYEIKYASLLHDFGKIGVREDVLRKGQKLQPFEMTVIKQRFESIENRLKIKCLETYLEKLMRQNSVPSPEELARIEGEVKRVSVELNDLWHAVVSANEPQIVHTDSRFIDFAAVKILLGDEPIEVLSGDEISRLLVKRGSLSPEERKEIESHVTHSHRFLAKIPWTSELANVPEIVYAHHERLDGSGYPRKLISDEIPVQARLMAITDIFDALVAMDRPYKKAVSFERAFEILDFEVKEGKLDSELFNIFLEAGISEIIRPNIGKVA